MQTTVWSDFPIQLGIPALQRPGDFNDPIDFFGADRTIEDTSRFWSVGFNTDYRNFVAYAEYTVRDGDPEAAAIFPNQKAWYTTVGYRFGKLLPHFTYSSIDKLSDEGVDDPAHLATEETSMTFGMRYELAASAALKFEVTRVDPEGPIDSVTGDAFGFFEDPFEDETGLYYGLGIDLVF
jgi:predicted porin